MQTIKRDIYVTKNVLQAPIEVTEGTNSIAIEFDVRDYDIPASAAAVAYSLSTSSMEEPNKALADVSGNKITIIPSETFFLPGQNVMQVRIIDGNSKLISFNIIVKCTGKMRFGDEKEAQQSTLIEQMLAKLGEYQKKSASPYNFKGSCLSSALPASGNTINDTYYCTDLKYRKTWNGSAWEQSSLNEADYEDELTKTNGEVSSLKKDINDLIISGKNLILGRTVNGYNIDISYNKKTGATKIYGTANATGRIILTPKITLTPGKYALSCEYQLTGNYKPAIYIMENSTKDGILGYGGTVISVLGISDKETTFNITENKEVSVELYFRANENYGADCYIQLEKGDKTEFEPFMFYNRYGEDFITKKELITFNTKIDFSNMIMNCMGDSLTYGYINSSSRLEKPYPALLEKKLNLKKCNNYGITGTTVANTNANSMCNRIADMENGAKIISILGGTNDKTNNVPLGDISSTDNTNFYGALKSIVTQLISKYGSNYTTYNVFIFLITPTHSSISDKPNNLGLTLKDYRDAVIDVGTFYGIPVLDLYSKSRLSQNTVGYTYDGVHWKQEYVEYIIEPMFRNFIINNMVYPLS